MTTTLHRTPLWLATLAVASLTLAAGPAHTTERPPEHEELLATDPVVLVWATMNLQRGSTTRDAIDEDTVVELVLDSPSLEAMQIPEVTDALEMGRDERDPVYRHGAASAALSMTAIEVMNLAPAEMIDAISPYGEFVGLMSISGALLAEMDPYEAARWYAAVAMQDVDRTEDAFFPGSEGLAEGAQALHESNLLLTDMWETGIIDDLDDTVSDVDFSVAFNEWTDLVADQTGQSVQTILMVTTWAVAFESHLKDELDLRDILDWLDIEAISTKAAALLGGGNGSNNGLAAMGNLCASPDVPTSPWGLCGMPGVDMDDTVDPSPIDFTGVSDVQSGLSTTVETPVWMLPGSCYGLQPRALINGAATGGGWDDAFIHWGATALVGTVNVLFTTAGGLAGGPKLAAVANFAYMAWVQENQIQEAIESAAHAASDWMSGAENGTTWTATADDGTVFEGETRQEAMDKANGHNSYKLMYDTIHGTDTPDPLDDSSSLLDTCLSSAVSALLGGCTDPTVTETITQTDNLLACKDWGAMGPDPGPDPEPQPMVCTCTVGDGGGDGSGNGGEGGGGDCCPQMCMAAYCPDGEGCTGPCAPCSSGAQMCGSGSSNASGGSLMALCQSDLGFLPGLVNQCGALDPSPIDYYVIDEMQEMEDATPRDDTQTR